MFFEDVDGIFLAKLINCAMLFVFFFFFDAVSGGYEWARFTYFSREQKRQTLSK